MPLDARAQQMGPHIKGYEWAMVARLAEQIETRWAESDKFTQNHLLEGLLLHARLLRDFYIKKPKESHPNDVLAWHFFDDPTQWEEKQRDLCPYLLEHRTRINQRLPHLSYGRLTQSEDWKGWDFEAIFSELNNARLTFLGTLPNDRRAWFE